MSSSSGSSSVCSQIARPSWDYSTDSWSPSTGASVAGVIDEVTPSDSDYAYRDFLFPGFPGEAKINLTSISDPGVHTGHVMRVRAKLSHPSEMSFTLTLVQDIGGGESTIRSWSPTLTDSYATYEVTLSSGEAAAISDYSILGIKLYATKNSGDEFTTYTAYVSWFELEVPCA